MFFQTILLLLLMGQCPSKCPQVYEPVCGTDGKTYTNECFLRIERECKGKPHLKVKNTGICKLFKSEPESFQCDPAMKDGVCTKEYFPLCGNDGKTYGNKCVFCYNLYKIEEQGNSLVLSHYGECQPEDYCPLSSKNGVCTLDYRPICANDGKTYPNICSMCATMYEQQQQGHNIILRVSHEGICKNEKIIPIEAVCSEKYASGVCTKEYFPMCGSDGKTYGNKCLYCYAKFQKQENGEELTLNHLGPCTEPIKLSLPSVECSEKDKTDACTKEYFPICGNDGKTYANRCIFCYNKFMQQKNGYELVVDHIGKCTREPSCNPMSQKGACPFNYSPVCSNEGKTYANECLLCADLYRRQKNGENIHLHIEHQGVC